MIGPDWSKVKPALRDALTAAIARQAWPVFMFGAQGRGKTYAAACVYQSWPMTARWYETGELIQTLIECRTNGKGYVVRMKQGVSVDVWPGALQSQVSDASLVVFDDLGLRQESDARYEAFFGLVQSRIGKPTIYSSNLDPAGLESVYDGRIASRLLSGTILELTGQDRRLEGRTIQQV